MAKEIFKKKMFWLEKKHIKKLKIVSVKEKTTGSKIIRTFIEDMK